MTENPKLGQCCPETSSHDSTSTAQLRLEDTRRRLLVRRPPASSPLHPALPAKAINQPRRPRPPGNMGRAPIPTSADHPPQLLLEPVVLCGERDWHGTPKSVLSSPSPAARRRNPGQINPKSKAAGGSTSPTALVEPLSPSTSSFLALLLFFWLSPSCNGISPQTPFFFPKEKVLERLPAGSGISILSPKRRPQGTPSQHCPQQGPGALIHGPNQVCLDPTPYAERSQLGRADLGRICLLLGHH